MSETPAVRRPRPKRDEELEVTIESLAYGGAGVGRSDGFVVFVRGALPGDRVRARVGKSKRSYAEATVVELLEPSPDRIEPATPHPGAPWQVLPYERQLEVKQAQVVEALERLGGFEAPPVEPIVPAVDQLRYRNKVEYSFGEDEDGRMVLGSHRAGRWDVIDELTADVLASERVDELRNAIADWCREQEVPPYDRRDQSGVLRNLVIREGRRTGELQARLVIRRKDARDRRAGRLGAGRQLPDDARRRARRDDPGRRDGVGQGSEEALRGARGRRQQAALRHLAGGLLPDQHRDVRAALRDRRRARRADRPPARLRPLLRHRHDRDRAVARGARGDRRRDRRGGGRRRDRQRRARTASTTPASTRATSAPRCAR